MSAPAKYFKPIPPERGAFPLDHDGDCKEFMQDYLSCLKLTKNNNAANCRLLAKNYLNCRMDNELMDRVPWNQLGLPQDKNEKKASVDKK